MLECEARGVPLPAITWYRNGEAILSSNQAQYVDRGHFLRIPRAQASDTGQFSCRVTSVAGTAEKNFELDVYRKYPNSSSLYRKYPNSTSKSWTFTLRPLSASLYCTLPNSTSLHRKFPNST